MKGKDKNWYVYNEAIMNRLEYDLVKLMGSFIQELEAKYQQVYLIRNDEKSTRYRLTEFDGTRGFMPDFILYLENQEFVYQVFIEPKGEDREKEDIWKQEMLYEMNKQIEIIGENKDVCLYGVKFYNAKNKEEFIHELSEKVNDGNSLDGKLDLFME
ncbi:hypothetical protein P3T75_04150 [Enterococcus montenegrensis]|uniref:hypothetical protein n=1 Tax=Enterococcus montenegrensis TaxID=3031993 RepID=UPI00249F62C6|nr:hypothetical protein [Enterococcus montenegrensis]WHA10040.1 hypothetical protein P3T75_04150 [Enterococcus montenegrensis]